MAYDRFYHHRCSIRLANYDYSATGMYFLTLCVFDRKCLFGDALNGKMILNNFGRIAEEEWLHSFDIHQELILDQYCIMPNHMHCVVGIGSHDPGTFNNGCLSPCDGLPRVPEPKSIRALMAGYRSVVTKRINLFRNTPGHPVWQRNYYNHIIRDRDELERIRKYIRENPVNWDIDEFIPQK